jgi:hypothetical protein
MVRFPEVFPELTKVNALRAQLSWTYFRELIAMEDSLKRWFYAELCRTERWSARTLTRTQTRVLLGWYNRPIRGASLSPRGDSRRSRDGRKTRARGGCGGYL